MLTEWILYLCIAGFLTLIIIIRILMWSLAESYKGCDLTEEIDEADFSELGKQ